MDQRKRITRNMLVLTLSTVLSTVFLVYITLVLVSIVRHHYEYHDVPAKFLTTIDARDGRVFMSYRPFPFNLFKPKTFQNGAVIYYISENGEGVAQIQRKETTESDVVIYTIKDGKTDELIQIYHKQIVAKD